MALIDDIELRVFSNHMERSLFVRARSGLLDIVTLLWYSVGHGSGLGGASYWEKQDG
jgi:hypothetical protein